MYRLYIAVCFNIFQAYTDRRSLQYTRDKLMIMKADCRPILLLVKKGVRVHGESWLPTNALCSVVLYPAMLCDN